jgi:hypothetical protein
MARIDLSQPNTEHEGKLALCSTLRRDGMEVTRTSWKEKKK